MSESQSRLAQYPLSPVAIPDSPLYLDAWKTPITK